MKHLRLLLLIPLLLAGCGKSAPGPAASFVPPAGGSPTQSATPGASPSALASPEAHFTVDGAGPYQLGAKLADLQAAGKLAEVSAGGEVCPGITTARGTPPWEDIRLSFRSDGTLYLVVNRSTSIPTPSGAWLGDTLAQLKSIYGAVPGEELTKGSAKAFLVITLSGRGILFDINTSTGKVFAMVAGDGDYLKSSYLGGTDYC